MNLFDLTATLKIDSSNFEKGISNSENKGKKLSTSLVGGFKTIKSAFHNVSGIMEKFSGKIGEAGLKSKVA